MISSRASTAHSGPRKVFWSMGSPGVTPCTACAKLSTNASYASSSTMNRLELVHAWPLLSMRPKTPCLTVRSTFSASSTMKGSEPPSSSTTFLRFLPAVAATAEPARSEPVRDTPCTAGSGITMSATCSLDAKMLM